MALTNKLSAIGDAIRSKTGGSELLTLDQMPREIESIETGYSLEDIASHKYQFSGSVTLPTATEIGAYAFWGSNITEIHAPNVERIYSDTFYTGIGAFQNCKSLKVVDMPNLHNCGSGGYQFAGCTSLENVKGIKNIAPGTHCFDGCTALKWFVSTSTMQGNYTTFVNCSALQSVDWATVRLNTTEFQGCRKLNKLILRNSEMATLNNINVFTNTPFASNGTGGTLYVPQALIEEYQAATNWTTILNYPKNQILPIEGSIYETEYGDGTPIE